MTVLILLVDFSCHVLANKSSVAIQRAANEALVGRW